MKQIIVKKYSLEKNILGILLTIGIIYLSYYVFVMPEARPFSIVQDGSIHRAPPSSLGYVLFVVSSIVTMIFIIKKRFIGGLYEEERIMLEEIYKAEKQKRNLSIYKFSKLLKQNNNSIYQRKTYRIIEELERFGYIEKEKNTWKLTNLGKKLIAEKSE